MTSGAAASRYARALFDVVVADSATKLEAAQSDLQAFSDQRVWAPKIEMTTSVGRYRRNGQL